MSGHRVLFRFLRTLGGLYSAGATPHLNAGAHVECSPNYTTGVLLQVATIQFAFIFTARLLLQPQYSISPT